MSENRASTRIVERDQILTVSSKSLHIVRNSCLYYGKSFEAATNSSKLILNKYHKLPIVAAHDFGTPLILLPTMSAKSGHNVWIALHAIDNLKGDKTGCTIYLENDYTIKVDVSENTINRQHTLGGILIKNFHKKQRQLSGRTPTINMNANFPFSKNKP